MIKAYEITANTRIIEHRSWKGEYTFYVKRIISNVWIVTGEYSSMGAAIASLQTEGWNQ